jgi:putative CocE/NonD family hydrolase
MFVPRGYAVVVVDVRGTGASFGTRDSFRSPRERADYRAVADWIVSQPWSDGSIGATGISYLGAACDFLASTGHKAVKAIAPLFAVWDTWADNYYPGGLLIKRLALTYDELMLALDHDRRDLRGQFSYFANPALLGAMPVDDDRDGALAREAVKGHLANFRMPDFISEFKCRDDALPYDPSITSASFSPYNYLDEMPQDVAARRVGWMDGAGYANGAPSRFPIPANAERRARWDRGTTARGSTPRRGGRGRTEFPVVGGEVLRFFDRHLAAGDLAGGL